MIGLFYEMGPLEITPQLKLKQNWHTWNKFANMLFVDSPVGTGFSYVNTTTSPTFSERNPNDYKALKSLFESNRRTNRYNCTFPDPTKEKPKWQEGFPKNQPAVSHDLITFLDRFYRIFPELLKTRLYITGESYAGKYVPALAWRIDVVNQKRQENKIPLAGIAIGNGLTDPISQVKVYLKNLIYKAHGPLALSLGLVSEKDAELMNIFAKLAIDFICNNGDYINALDARMLIFGLFKNSTGGINWFVFALIICRYDVRRSDKEYERHEMYMLLRDPNIQKMLNIQNYNSFEKDARVEQYLAEDIMKSSAGYFPRILKKGYKVLLYQGQFDFRDGVLSQNDWVKSINWPYKSQFNNAPRKIWKTAQDLNDERVAGFVTAFQNLVRVELLNAGHLAPGDQGFNSAEMIKLFLLE